MPVDEADGSVTEWEQCDIALNALRLHSCDL